MELRPPETRAGVLRFEGIAAVNIEEAIEIGFPRLGKARMVDDILDPKARWISEEALDFGPRDA